MKKEVKWHKIDKWNYILVGICWGIILMIFAGVGLDYFNNAKEPEWTDEEIMVGFVQEGHCYQSMQNNFLKEVDCPKVRIIDSGLEIITNDCLVSRVTSIDADYSFDSVFSVVVDSQFTNSADINHAVTNAVKMCKGQV